MDLSASHTRSNKFIVFYGSVNNFRMQGRVSATPNPNTPALAGAVIFSLKQTIPAAKHLFESLLAGALGWFNLVDWSLPIIRRRCDNPRFGSLACIALNNQPCQLLASIFFLIFIF